MRMFMLSVVALVGLMSASMPVLACDDCGCGVTSHQDEIKAYATLVHDSYVEAHDDAVAMQKAIKNFLANPNDKTLAAARQAWLDSRPSYGHTEAFRFYEGPIDFYDEVKDESGPEGRLNAWPLNEKAIDAIVEDTSIPMTREAIAVRNQADDEADVTTGYHAIEYLLWGADLSADGPGNRPASDFAKGDEIRERRREYLQVITDLLVDDLVFLVQAWDPQQTGNYREQFVAANPQQTLSDVLTGVATLVGSELASARMGVGLDSGDQEDEHSCFSDNTHVDFIANTRSAELVLRNGGDHSLLKLMESHDSEAAARVDEAMTRATKLASEIVPPVDRILASPKGDPARRTMEELVTALLDLGNAVVDAGKKMDVEVLIIAE